MKRYISVLIVFVLLFSLGACGAPQTVDDACKKADKQVSKWNDDRINACTYSSSLYTGEDGRQIYYVALHELTYFDYTEAARVLMPKSHADYAYNGIKEYFTDFPDVDICVIVFDGNGEADENTLIVTLNGREVPKE